LPPPFVADNTATTIGITTESGFEIAMKPFGVIVSLAFLFLNVCLGLGGQAGLSALPGKTVPKPPGEPTFKVDVNLVLVEVGVHDEHGRAVGDLTQKDFRIFEDGKEQVISSFSHEELPLAVALVIDNSSSIVAALHELRAGALDTLSLLRPDDQVAIFSFGAQPELVEGLTSNHEALSVDLWALEPYGGTAIDDALYDAALYLGRTAPDRRRAVILVSDNEASDDQTRDVVQVVHAAQESGTPIYSVKVGFLRHSRAFFLTHSENRLHDVGKICKETGGEMIDTQTGISVSSAMEKILTWLKQGYTLGYSPTNKRQDGSYRTIEVRLNDPDGRPHKNTLYARPGYNAPTGQ
jgi:Ca-activated chloride channel family protein